MHDALKNLKAIVMDDSEIEAIRKKKMMTMLNNESKTIPNEIVEISNVDAFNQLVNDYPDNLILVDCWAPWCGPCRAFGPIFKQLRKEYFQKGVIFTKLNTDENQDIARQFNITGIPTTLMIHNKKLVQRSVGLQNKVQFGKTIDTLLEKIIG